MAKFLKIQQGALGSRGETAPGCHWPTGSLPRPMNSSCPTQRVSIIDAHQPLLLSSLSRLQWPRMASGAPRLCPQWQQTLFPHHIRFPLQEPFLNHRSHCSVSAHFKYGQRERGICLSEVGETPVVITLGFLEPLGATPRTSRVWPPARLQ